jgi:phosphoribosylformylglycinamidine synthase subunit PurSL
MNDVKDAKYSRLEIGLKKDLFDSDGMVVINKAKNIGIELTDVRKVNVLSLVGDLNDEQKEEYRLSMTNPVTQDSSYSPLFKNNEADWFIHNAWKPGVKDNEGATALEQIVDIFSEEYKDTEVYFSKIYAIKGDNLTKEKVDKISLELSNDIVQTYKNIENINWDNNIGIGEHRPKVILNHEPGLDTIPLEKLTSEFLQKYSDDRSLALNSRDIPIIIDYFNDPKILEKRALVGLKDPTDVELEYIAQARSDHCNHNTFGGKFNYFNLGSSRKNEGDIYDDLFKICIKDPTLKLKDEKDHVISVLWDNAGVARFDENNNYVITGETHNSPSNMEAYGGAITGIVGVYRDPMGTGIGSKIIFGSFGYCTADPNIDSDLEAKLHPRQLLDGVIDGVKDGGNKSGNPTIMGKTLFHSNYLGKSLVFVTTGGIMPSVINGEPSHEKEIALGDLMVMSGGRVGKDGIHGVTAASEENTENTPAGHVQIGDPYTQKKMHDFLLDARDEGLSRFITDNGGGGLSSSIGETTREINTDGFSGGSFEIDKVPLKYEGLDLWEIWVSESQERMTIAVKPECIDRFMELSKQHGVESTVIGKYNSDNALHMTYNGKSIAYITSDFLEQGFPQWKFTAEWTPPKMRGLYEPVIGSTKDQGKLLETMLTRPNICSKEYIFRQKDHEVQGTSVIKPLVGVGDDGVSGDIPSDAAIIRPILGSNKGLVFAQTLNPEYSKIDAKHMTTATIDEGVRGAIAVGGNLDEIGGLDNFCWPCIESDAVKNPDGKFKAAQLVRANLALKEACETYEIPLLSGKDSMYVDGHPTHSATGVKKKVSGLETMQFVVTTTIDDVANCITSDAKEAHNLIYLVGETKNELGASEFYSMLDETGLNVPKTDMKANMEMYKTFVDVRDKGYMTSIKNVSQKNGLLVDLVLMAAGGNLGFYMDLNKVNAVDCPLDEQILYSGSTGRMLVEVTPENQENFEKGMGDYAKAIGAFNDVFQVYVKNRNDDIIIEKDIMDLKKIWKESFKDQSYIVREKQ